MDDWKGTPRQLFEAARADVMGQVERQKSTMYFEVIKLCGYNGKWFHVAVEAKKVVWCRQWAAPSLERSIRRELGRKVEVVFMEKEETQPQMPLFAPEPEVVDVGESDGREWW